MIALKATGVNYSYGDGTTALEKVDLEVNRGEIVAVLGPNGAGKSTLLKILAGLQFPRSGEVEVFGERMTGKNADGLRKRLGLLFQDPDDQIFMPRVWDDVAFGPINHGLDEEGVRERVESALEIVGMTSFSERAPHHLSFGEKKRVAIAGVLAMKPDILLLDEPTANLDPGGRKELLDFVSSLDCTTVIATHDMDAAARISDRAVVLDGTVLFSGRLVELLNRESLLKEARLEMPDLTRLFIETRGLGPGYAEPPLNVDDAIELLSRFLKEMGRH